MARVGKKFVKFSKPVVTVFMALALVLGLGGVSVATNLVNTTQAAAKISYSAAIINKSIELDAANNKTSATTKVFISIDDADYGYNVEESYAYYIMPISGKYYQVPLTHSGTTWEGSITLTTSMENGEWKFAGIGTQSSIENDQFDNNAADIENADFTLSGASDVSTRPIYKLGSASVSPETGSSGTEVTCKAKFETANSSTGAQIPTSAYAYLRSPSNTTSKQVTLTGGSSGEFEGKITLDNNMEAGKWKLCVVQGIADDGTIWTYNLALEDGEENVKYVTVSGTSGVSTAPTYTSGSAKAKINPIVQRDQTISLKASVGDGASVTEVHAYYTKPVSGLKHELVLYDDDADGTWEGTIPEGELNEKGTWQLNCVQMKSSSGVTSYAYSADTPLSTGDFIVNTPLEADEIQKEFEYTGEDLTTQEGLQPIVRDAEAGAAVVENTDYKISFKKVTEKADDGSITATEATETVKDAGDYLLVVEGLGHDRYEGNMIELPFTVTKAKLNLDAPESTEETYSGTAQNLINAISNATQAGAQTVYYCTSTASEAPAKYKAGTENEVDTNVWSTSVPQGTDAGRYQIYYWAVGDNNHYDTDVLNAVSIPVDIGEDPITRTYSTIYPKEIKVTPTIEDKTYDATNKATAKINFITGVNSEVIQFAPANSADGSVDEANSVATFTKAATFDSVNADDRVHVTFNTTETVKEGEGDAAKEVEKDLIKVTVKNGSEVGKLSNYTITYDTNKLYAKIAQKEIRVKIPTYIANDKTYDGTKTATLASFDVTVPDIKNAQGANEQLTISGLEGEFASEKVAVSDKTDATGVKEIADQDVSVTENSKNNPTVVGIGTSLASNYKVTLVDGDSKPKAKITRADAVIRAAQLSKTPSGDEPKYSATVTGLQNGETFTENTDYTLSRSPKPSTDTASSDTVKYYLIPTCLETDTTKNYNVKCVSTEFLVQNEQILVTEPQANANLVYNGASQQLITAGTTGSNATLYYTINEEKPASVSAISTLTDSTDATKIAATDAGTYSVYFGAAKTSDGSSDTGVLGPVDNVKIAKKPITDTEGAGTESARTNPITIEIDDVQYGSTSNPKVKITMKVGAGDDASAKEDYTLKEGDDYYVTFRDNESVGTAKAVIIGTGKNFTGTTNQSYEVKSNDAGAKVANQTMTYGKDVPTFTAQFSGLQSGDSMTEGVDYDFKVYKDQAKTQPITVNSETPVGTYYIELVIYSNKNTRNYNFDDHIWDGITTPTGSSYKDPWVTTDSWGRLTIEPDTLKVQAPTVKTLTYNGSAQALINNDGKCTKGGTLYYKIADTKPSTADSDWSTELPTATNAGTYKIWYYAKADDGSSYTDSEVFELSTPAEIQKYNLKVSPTVKDKTYDGTTAGKAKLDTVNGVNGETLTFNKKGTTDSLEVEVVFSSPDVGYRVSATLPEGALNGLDYTVTGGQANKNNYNLTYNDKALAAQIFAKEITLNIPSSALNGGVETSAGSGKYVGTKVYDATNVAKIDAFDVTYAGTNEKFNVRGVSGTYENANVGTEKKITPVKGADGKIAYSQIVGINGAKASNYSITLAVDETNDPLKGTITQAPATITLGNGTKAFGEKDPDFNTEKNQDGSLKYVTKIEGLITPQGGTADTLTAGTDFKVVRDEGDNVGTYAIGGEAQNTTVANNYKITFVKGTYTITQAKSSLTKAPVSTGTEKQITVEKTDKDGKPVTDEKGTPITETKTIHALPYNLQYQDLTTEGQASGGTVVYLADESATLTADDLKSRKSQFSSRIPQLKDVGTTQYIYYYVRGDENHIDTFCFEEEGYQPVETTMVAKDISDSDIEIASIADQTYTGSEIQPEVTVKYYLDETKTNIYELRADTDFTYTKYENNVNVTPDTATAEQKPTVTITGTGNYTGTKTATFKIIPIEPKVQIDSFEIDYGDSLTWTDILNSTEFVDLPSDVKLTRGTDYDIEIWTKPAEGSSEESTKVTTNDGIPTDAGNYTFKFVPKSTTTMNNFKWVDTNYTLGTITINKINSSFTAYAYANELTYNEEQQTLCSEATANGGTVYYAVTDAQGAPTASTESPWSTTVPSKLDAGTYYVYYYVKGDKNHNDTEVQEIVPVINKVQVAAKINCDDKVYDGTTACTGSIAKVEGAMDEEINFEVGVGAIEFTSKDVKDIESDVVDTEPAAKIVDESKIKAIISGGENANPNNYDIQYSIDKIGSISARPYALEVPQYAIASSKEYDGNNIATVNSFTVGTTYGDTFVVSNLTGYYNDANVAADKSVTVRVDHAAYSGSTGKDLTRNYNFTLSANGLTSSITKRTAIVFCNDQEIEYGEDLPTFTYDFQYFVKGEVPQLGTDFEIATTATSKSSPGMYLLEPTFYETSSFYNNYRIVAQRGVLNITQGNTYTVRFDANGGDGTMEDQVVKRDEAVQLTKNSFTRNGYKFVGWSNDKFSKTPSISDEGSVTNATDQGGRLTLYAVWQENSYVPPTAEEGFTIKFDANGGEGEMTPQIVALDTPTTLAKNIFTREGYTFIGWSDKPGSTTRSAEDGGVIKNLAEKGGTKTLYAVWQENSTDPIDPATAYTVLFDANGGDGTMADQSIPADVATKLAPNLFTRDGYYFAGWSVSPTAVDASLSNEYTVTHLTDAGSKVTLYAVWKNRSDTPVDPKTNGYTVRFNGNGGVGEMVDQAIGINTTTPLASNIFKREGYTFIGWSTSPSVTSPSFTDNQSVNHIASIGETITLYAVWQDKNAGSVDVDNSYTVTFDANGGYGTMTTQTIPVDTPTKLAKCTFIRPGYTFLGWSTNSSAENAAFSDEYSVTNVTTAKGTITLYAVWASGTVTPVDPTTQGYTVHFDANGGDGTMQDQVIETGVSTPLAMNAFSRKGYKFLGWSQSYSDTLPSREDGSRVLDLTTKGSTVTLYAIWSDSSTEPVPEDETYTVHFDANGGSGTMKNVSIQAGKLTQLPTNVYKFDEYQFLGWSTNASDTSATYNNQAEVLDLVNKGERITLYAIWKDVSPQALAKNQSYAVYYNANGGTGDMANQYISPGSEVSLESNGFTREGYTFQGWSTSENATTPEFVNSQAIQDLASSGETVTLNAVWQSVNASVSQAPQVAQTSGILNNASTVEAGQAVGGTLMYGVSNNGTAEGVSSWSEAVPTNVGSSSKVFYYVKGDSNHANSPVYEVQAASNNASTVQTALLGSNTPLKAAGSMAVGVIAVGVIALFVYTNKRRKNEASNGEI